MRPFFRYHFLSLCCLSLLGAVSNFKGAIRFEKRIGEIDKFEVQPICNKWAKESSIQLPKEVASLVNQFTGLRVTYEANKQELLEDLRKGINHLAYYADGDDLPNIMQEQILILKKRIKAIEADKYRLIRIHRGNHFMDYLY